MIRQLLLLLFGIFTLEASQDTRVLIVGAPDYAVAKWDLVDGFFPHSDIEKRGEDHMWRKWGCDDILENSDIFSPKNCSCLAVSKLGVDEMSLDEIGDLYELMASPDGLVVVELGRSTVQLRALISKLSGCWGVGESDIATPNTVYLCGKVHPNHLPAIGIFNVKNVDEFSKPTTASTEITFWPCIFASAASADKKQKTEPIEVREEAMEDNGDDKKIEANTPKDTGKKLSCKYRKSCYESGALPEIEDGWDWSWTSNGAETTSNQKFDESDEDDSVVAQKLKCKYRKACYEEKGIDFSKKDTEDDEKLSFFSGKLAAPSGHKRTVKEIAEKTLQKVKEKDEEAKTRELPNSLKVERRLEAIDKENNRRLSCKYRKSCYDTGELPEIEQSLWGLPDVTAYFGAEREEADETEPNLDDLSESQRKFRCKYRKSCFDTGIVPKIAASSLSDYGLNFNFFEPREESGTAEKLIDDPNQTLQMKCKYRLSCYDTGILPDLAPPQENAQSAKSEEDVSIPTSAVALKHFCKYRKSCYEKIAASDGISAVKEIRKERNIERAVPSRLRGRRVLDAAGLLRRQTRREKLASRREAMLSKRAVEAQVQESETPKQQREKLMAEKVKVEKEIQHKSKRYQKEQVLKKEEDAPPDNEEPIPVPAPEPKKKEQKKKSKKSQEMLDETTIPVPIPEPVNEIVEEVEPEIKPKKTSKKSAEADVAKPQLESKKKKTKEAKRDPNQAPPEATEIKTAKKSKKLDEVPKEPEPEIQRNYEETIQHLGLNTALFETLEQQRMTCKYRKSCYTSGKVPEIDRSYADVLDDFNKHVEKQYETGLQKHLKEEDKKLACKYRKSCYETGELHIVHSEAPRPIPPPTASFSGAFSPKLKCKYRKSCYAEEGINFDDESARPIPLQHKEQKVESVIEKPKSAERSVEQEKKKKKEKHRPTTAKLEDSDYDNVSKDEKFRCKYRKSCYTGTEPPPTLERTPITPMKQARVAAPITTRPRAAGEKPRDHCHPYWFSCREWMGLPPKEKAPIGPNGKRLCRKKKAE
ncbi:unnamed protein product, partial [Mesorhabditis spiculigera]